MIPALVAILAIILESWSSIWHSVDLFLKSQQLTVGAIITAMVPFFVIWNKISKEKEKRVRAAIVERRQLQIAFNVNEIMEKLGVESKWSLQEIGSSHEVLPNLKHLRSLLRVVTIQRRKNLMSMLTNILKANLSKKLISAIVSMIIVELNYRFNLNIPEDIVWGILGLSAAHISLQTIIDSIKVWANSKLHIALQPVTKEEIKVLYDKFTPAVPFLNGVRDNLNSLLDDLRKDDGSQAFHLAMKAFAEIEPILKSYKIPEPVTVIVEDKVAS